VVFIAEFRIITSHIINVENRRPIEKKLDVAWH